MSMESNLAAFQAACFSLSNEPKAYESYGGQKVEITPYLQRGKIHIPNWIAQPKKGFLSSTLAQEIDRLFRAFVTYPLEGFKTSDVARQPYLPYKGKILYNQADDNAQAVQMQYALILNPACLLRPAKAAAFLKEFFGSYPKEFAVTVYVAKQEKEERLV